MIRALIVGMQLSAALFGTVACQSLPEQASPPQAAQRKTHLNPAQIAALKQEGFVESEEGWEFNASEKLLFGPDEAMLITAARQTVERIAHLLIRLDIGNVRIDGHTDTTGSVAHNEQLSLRRAQAVGEAMILAGMNPKGIQVRGLGHRMPIVSNQTAEGRAQNRRVVLVIASE